MDVEIKDMWEIRVHWFQVLSDSVTNVPMSFNFFLICFVLSTVIEIKSEDRGKFFDALSALLIPK